MLGDLDALQDTSHLDKLDVVEKQRQLMVAVPFMERFKVARFKELDEGYKNWWQVANRGISPGLELAGNIGAPLAQIPGIKQVVKQVAQVGEGWSLAKESVNPGVGLDITRGSLDDSNEVVLDLLVENDGLYKEISDQGGINPILDNFAKTPESLRQIAAETEDKTLAKKLRARATRVEKGGVAGRLLASFGRRVPKNPEDRQRAAESLWRQLRRSETPLPETAEELSDALGSFVRGYDAATDEWHSRYLARVTTSRSDAVKAGKALGLVGRTAFKVFAQSRKRYNQVFKTDFESGTTMFTDSEAVFRKDVARAATATLERAKLLMPAVKEAADELGMPVDKFRTLLASTLESSALREELDHFAGLAITDPAAFAVSAHKFVGRAQSALQTLGTVVREHGSDELRQLFESLQIGDILDEGVASVLEPTASRAAKKLDAPAPRWSQPHGYRITQGARKGDYLGYLSNKELNEALEGASEVDAETINQILDLRRKGLVKQAPRPKQPSVRPSQQGFREGAAQHLPEGYLTETGQLLADLSSAMFEAKRLGANTPPSVIKDIEESLAKFSGWVEGTVRQGLGARGKQVLDYFRETQKEILMQGIKAGTIKASSPLGYLPRILSNSGRRVLRELTGAVPAELKGKLAPQLSGVFKRSLDEYTITELNILYDEARKLAPDSEFVKGLGELAEAEGIKLEKFTSAPEEALLERFSQAQRSESTAKFLDNILDTASHQNDVPVKSFRVKGYVDLEGKPRQLATFDKPRTTSKTSPQGDVVITRNEEVVEAGNVRGLLLEDENGVEIMFDTATLGDGLSMYPAGSGGATVGEAIAARGARGELDQGFLEAGTRLNPGVMEELVGQHVLLGDRSVVAGMLELTGKQFKGGNAAWAMYDRAHGIVKRFQTIYRPDFHLANHFSSIFQTRMIDGVSMAHIMGAHLDLKRALYFDQDEVVKALDPASRILGTDGLTSKLPNFGAVQATRRAGVTTTEQFVKGEVYIRVGDQMHDLGDILQAAADEGLFGNFTIEGLRGSSTASEMLTKMRELVEADGKLARTKQRAAKAVSKIESLGSASEDAARLMSVFAQLRAGYSVKNAVKQTKQVMVDYTDLTRVEMGLMKRLFSFYTFPRKFMPVAWQKFNEDPSSIASIAHLFGGLETSGQLTTEGGRASLALGDDFSINLGRMNAGADAMMMLPGLIAATGLMPDAELEGTPGVAEASSFFQLRAPTQLAFSMFDRDLAGDPGLMEEFMEIAPLSEWLMTQWQGGDPDIERTPLESIADALLPISKKAPDHRRRVRLARLGALERQLERRLEDAAKRGDQEDLQALRQEMRRLGETFKLMNRR